MQTAHGLGPRTPTGAHTVAPAATWTYDACHFPTLLSAVPYSTILAQGRQTPPVTLPAGRNSWQFSLQPTGGSYREFFRRVFTGFAGRWNLGQESESINPFSTSMRSRRQNYRQFSLEKSIVLSSIRPKSSNWHPLSFWLKISWPQNPSFSEPNPPSTAMERLRCNSHFHVMVAPWLRPPRRLT